MFKNVFKKKLKYLNVPLNQCLESSDFTKTVKYENEQFVC